MPKTTQHVPGSFCWIELNTTDVAAAKQFYGALFGWQTEDMPAGPDMTYTMFNLHDMPLGGMCNLQPEQLQHGVPAHWMSYVSVENADQSAARAQELGAQLLMEPFDVMQVGRMAVLADPQGGHFCIWQAQGEVGCKLEDENGTWCWHELWAHDPEAAKAFYTSLFGWQAKVSEVSEATEYTEWSLGGQSFGGMFKIEACMGPMPSNWLPYFMVDDCDATAATAKANGGQVQMAPMDIPRVGRFAVIADPQGANFAVIKLNMVGKMANDQAMAGQSMAG